MRTVIAVNRDVIARNLANPHLPPEPAVSRNFRLPNGQMVSTYHHEVRCLGPSIVKYDPINKELDGYVTTWIETEHPVMCDGVVPYILESERQSLRMYAYSLLERNAFAPVAMGADAPKAQAVGDVT